MGITTITFRDLWYYIRRKDKGKVKPFDLLPFAIVPALIMICSLSPVLIPIVMGVLGVAVLVSYLRFQQNRSQFFFAWTLASGLYLFSEFEYCGLLLVTPLENLLVVSLLICSHLCLHKTRNIANREPITDIQNFNRNRLDCCVSRANYVYFFGGQVFVILALFFGVDIGLTNVCHSYQTFGKIMIPDDCTFAWDSPEKTKILASSLYAMGCMCVILLSLTHQIIEYVPKYYLCGKRKNTYYRLAARNSTKDEPASSGDSGDESGSDPESPGEKLSQANLRQDWACNSNTERDAGSSREPQASTSSTTQEADSSKASQSSMPKILPKIDLPGGAMLYHPGVLAGLDGLSSNLGLGNLAMRYPHSFILGLANQGQEVSASSTQPQFITIPLSMAMGNQPANGCPSASSDDSSELQDLSTGGRK